MKLNEGYKEIDEINNLADIIIDEFVFNTKELFKNNINNEENYDDIIDYISLIDIINFNKEKISKYKVINNFLANISSYNDIKITIYPQKGTKQTEAEYSEEWPSKKINIFYSSYIFNYFINSLIKDPNKFTDEILKKAYNVIIKTAIVHELQHAFDDFKSNGKYTKNKKTFEYFKNISEKNENEFYKDYLNLPHEYWARFSQYITKNDKKFYINLDFITILNNFKKSDIIKYYAITDPNDKKRLIKALYKYWYINSTSMPILP